MVRRKPYNITLYVHCLSVYIFILTDISTLTNKHNFDVGYTKGRVVLSNHAWYTLGPSLDFRPGHRLSRAFHGFHQSL
jgi:hypothetical protein